MTCTIENPKGKTSIFEFPFDILFLLDYLYHKSLCYTGIPSGNYGKSSSERVNQTYTVDAKKLNKLKVEDFRKKASQGRQCGYLCN